MTPQSTLKNCSIPNCILMKKIEKMERGTQWLSALKIWKCTCKSRTCSNALECVGHPSFTLEETSLKMLTLKTLVYMI